MTFFNLVGYINLVLTFCILAFVVSQNFKIYTLMPTIKEIQAKVDELQATLDDEQAQIRKALDDLNAVVTQLQSQLADGGTNEDRQAVLDKLNAISDDLKSTIPDAPPAETTPPAQ